jgi:hypothetical protein
MSQIIINKNNNLPNEIIECINKLSKLKIYDNAKLAHKQIADFLSNEGLNVVYEYPVENRGDGRKGRIDLMVDGFDKPIGIEIDQASPRKKSIFKLNSINDIYRVIILRKGEFRNLAKGIHIGIVLDLINN